MFDETLRLIGKNGFLFLLSLPLFVSAQSPIRGKAIDANSKEPMALVNIYVTDHSEKSFWGTFSDENGNFNVNAPLHPSNDTLIFSHIGYKSKHILLDSLPIDSLLIIELEEEIKYLQPVQISPMAAKEDILECINRRKENYFDVAFNNNCFFWHWIKENRQYKYLSQSFHSVAEDLSSSKLNLRIAHDSLQSNRNDYYVSFLDSVTGSFIFDIMRTGGQFINSANLNDWKFRYDDNTHVAENYVLIKGTSLDNFIQAQILVNETNFAIEQIDYHIQWESELYHHLNDTLLYRMKNLDGKIIYKKNATKYFVQLVQNHTNYEVFSKKNYQKIAERETESELVVFSSHELIPRQGLKPNPAPAALKRKQENIVINKTSFCEAASALHYASDVCN